MEIVRKWLFRTSTGVVENLGISHDEDESEVDEFVNDTIKKIQENNATKQYRTRKKTGEVISCLNKLLKVELENENFINNANSQLTKVAKRLVNVESSVDSQYGHLNKIQKGELLLVLLRDDDTNKFLLSKVELVTMLNTDNISIAKGIIKDIKSLWKSCLFTMEEHGTDEDSYYIADVYSSTKSKYWHHRFLELDEMTSDEVNTKRSFTEIDKLLGREIKTKFPSDYTIIRNSFVQYYRRGGNLDYNEMISEVFDSYTPGDKSFTAEKKEKISKKLKELPNKKSGGFDRLFKSEHSVLNVRIKKTYPLRTGVKLVINDGIDNIQRVIYAEDDPRNGKRLIISIDDDDTYNQFYQGQSKNEE